MKAKTQQADNQIFADPDQCDLSYGGSSALRHTRFSIGLLFPMASVAALILAFFSSPIATVAAAAGCDKAALWLIKRDYQHHADLLPRLVADQVPAAMYFQGRIDLASGRVGQGNALIAKAAKAGDQEAAAFVAKKAVKKIEIKI